MAEQGLHIFPHLGAPHIVLGVRALIVACIGFLLLRGVSALVKKGLHHKCSKQSAMIIQKMVFYVGMAILTLYILRILGVNISLFVGAAGVMGVALGFASQTSVSNVISGLFLIFEKPFQVGDIVEVNGRVGKIHAIDLLSMKLKLPDNKMVRIPNETLLKSEVINYTHSPIRRWDFIIGVSYKDDIAKVTRVLRECIEGNVHCLKEPESVVRFHELAESSLNFFVGVWFEHEDFNVLVPSLLMQIKLRFDQEGIDIPFKQLTVQIQSGLNASQ